jgi:hypothetical protein
MNILVACEFSGIVRDAFIAKGHNAISCDLLPTEQPGPHIQDNVLNHLNDGWDLMIAHPPCTNLACVGRNHFKEKWKDGRCTAALEFVFELMTSKIPRYCIENPVGLISTNIMKPSQIIQPWMFGHEEQKTTCLWLYNLPKLQPTKIVGLPLDINKRKRIFRGQIRNNWSKIRSITYQGIAKAMAEQWGELRQQAGDRE